MPHIFIPLEHINNELLNIATQIKTDLERKENRELNFTDITFFVQYGLRIQALNARDIFEPRVQAIPIFNPNDYGVTALTGKLGRKSKTLNLNLNERAVVLNLLEEQWNQGQEAAMRFNALTEEEREEQLNNLLAGQPMFGIF